VSGGYDSTLMSLMAQEEGLELFPLFVHYGQLGAAKEWEACKRLHEKHGLPTVTRMDLSGFGKTIPSGITDSRLRINEDAFLPGRNLLFILAGAAHAFKVQAHAVAIGLLNPAEHMLS
jgi:7-cyano-7-deazaguanine synthase